MTEQALNDVARLIASHRAVPFLGAGCSVAHVGVDWTTLMKTLNGDRVDVVGPIAAASEYVSAHGRDAFIDALRHALLIEKFDDSRGGVPLRVLAMAVMTLYTTNQDNVIERCFELFGRPLNVVATLEDFGRQEPLATTLYKYHGHLDHPDTVVFTQEDYDRRMAVREHPLDIRLRSDCLSKSMLFLGFSFNDPNIRDFFGHLRAVFGGALPPSYLVAFRYDREFADQLQRELGIVTIDTSLLFPSIGDPAERFERFMADLNARVVSLRSEQEIEAMFEARPDTGRKTVAKYEVEAVAKHLEGASFEAAVSAFRETYDGSVIAPSFEEEVSRQFVEICKRASEAEHYEDVKAAFFNLALRNGGFAFKAWVACCAAANLVDDSGGFGLGLSMPNSLSANIDERMSVVAAALAFDQLHEWGRQPTKAFYSAVAFWDVGFVHPDELKPELRQAVSEIFGRYYAHGKTTYENPFHRARRLAKLGHPLSRPRTLRDHHEKLISLFPKARRKPFNDG